MRLVVPEPLAYAAVRGFCPTVSAIVGTPVTVTAWLSVAVSSITSPSL